MSFIYGAAGRVYLATDLGLMCDGVTDDTAAFQSIPSAVPDGSTIVFPATRTVVTAGMSYSNKSLRFVGSGLGTEIALRGSNQVLFNLSLSDVLYTFGLESMMLLTNGSGNYAVNISRPSTASNIYTGPYFTDLVFRGEHPILDAWSCCIQLANCYNFRINRCHATGNQSYSMNFLNLAEHSTDGTVADCRVAMADYGIRTVAGGISEGIIVYGNKFVGVRHGIVLEDGNQAPGAQIFNNHINAFNTGIKAINRPQLQITCNLIYKYNSADFYGLWIEGGCASSLIQGNTVVGFSPTYSGTAVGLVIATTPNFMILDNIFENCAVGMDGINSSSGLDDRNTFINCASPRQSFNAPGHVSGTMYLR
ncbi:right-handed parallel beta-helix repeat-containing protein [Methylobacterium ajmalii]|uniref:Right-handed parallel beta-helix repeat-containing protein n=1 Tax=Methylobacterium ajmalii TaxID=2738439 RepID=A0ABV0A4L1_9HYPH